MGAALGEGEGGKECGVRVNLDDLHLARGWACSSFPHAGQAKVGALLAAASQAVTTLGMRSDDLGGCSKGQGKAPPTTIPHGPGTQQKQGRRCLPQRRPPPPLPPPGQGHGPRAVRMVRPLPAAPSPATHSVGPGPLEASGVSSSTSSVSSAKSTASFLGPTGRSAAAEDEEARRWLPSSGTSSSLAIACMRRCVCGESLCMGWRFMHGACCA